MFEALRTELLEIDSQINSGRGSFTLRAICEALGKNDLGTAQTIYGNDGDKLTQYDGVSKRIRSSVIGCRIHFVPNCDNPLCSRS